jgi:hypothetical protein
MFGKENAQAYYGMWLITTRKSFIEQAQKIMISNFFSFCVAYFFSHAKLFWVLKVSKNYEILI